MNSPPPDPVTRSAASGAAHSTASLQPAAEQKTVTLPPADPVGLALFGCYSLFYAGYIVASAWAPQTMQSAAVAGVNWAIVSGMSLIVGAILLALASLCLHRPET